MKNQTQIDPLAGIIQPEGFPGLPSGWSSDWETVEATDPDIHLFALIHKKEKPASGFGHRALFILHGYGEHGGRYLHVPHFVQEDVDLVYCLDHRGHGRSEGLRGHSESFDVYAEDAALAIRRLDERLKERFGKSEIHLLGHSMGGHLVIRMGFLFEDLPVKSITASAPFLDFYRQPPVLKRAAGRALTTLWGTLQLNSDSVDPKDLSHDQAVVVAYQRDRLVHSKATPKFYTELTAAMSDTMKRRRGFRYPLQLLVPLQDKVVDQEKALSFYRELQHERKRLKTYEGFYHESLNEIGKEKVFVDLVTWLREHHEAVRADTAKPADLGEPQ